MYREHPNIEHLREMANRNLEQFIHYTYRLCLFNSYLWDEITLLNPKIQHLENLLAKNSTNSSMPPSTDGFKRQLKTKSLRKKSDKAPGAQKGHKGSTLEMRDKPDEIIHHKLNECPVCKKVSVQKSGIRTRRVEFI